VFLIGINDFPPKKYFFDFSEKFGRFFEFLIIFSEILKNRPNFFGKSKKYFFSGKSLIPMRNTSTQEVLAPERILRGL